jgi:hypothetical protein
MSRSLGVLTLDLVAKTSGFVDGLSKAERASAKSSKQFEKDLDKLKGQVKLVTLAFAAGATAMIASSINMADQSRKTAQSIGLTTEALTGLQWAAKQSGVSNEQLATGFKQFSKVIQETSQGLGAGKETFKALGVSITDTSGQLKTSEQVFFDTANAIAAMQDGFQKTAYAQKLFGESGTKLIPLLNGGQAGIKALTDEAAKLGLVISDDTGKAAELFNDSLSVLNSQFRGTANLVAANVLPIMSELAAAFATSAKEGDGAKRSADAFTTGIKAVAQVAIGAVAYIETYAKGLAGLVFIASQVPKGMDAIKSAISLVGDEIDQNIRKYDTYLERVRQIGTEQPISGAPSIGGAIAGEAVGSNQTDKKINDDLQKRFEALEDSYKSERELLLEKHAEENRILADARAAGLATSEEFNMLEVEQSITHKRQLAELDKISFQEKVKMTSQALSNLSTLMNTNSRKMFEVGKAAALANAVVTGFDAAVTNYNMGSRIGGPPVGAAFAAASLAATGAQIQAISNTKFGGGSGGGASNTQAVNNASVGTTSAGQASPDRNVFIYGIEKNTIVTGEMVMDLVNNELSNGGKFFFK